MSKRWHSLLWSLYPLLLFVLLALFDAVTSKFHNLHVWLDFPRGLAFGNMEDIYCAPIS